ncbi:MAG: hypothetical protein ACLTDR_00650 [Adlercreutzia equolifaciens]
MSCMLDRAGEFPSRPDAMEVFRCRSAPSSPIRRWRCSTTARSPAP